MLNFDCGIYTISSPSGKQYVGSAVSFKERWRIHRRDLRRGTHHCAGLQRAFIKYGEAALTFAKIALVPRGELIAREQEQIDERAAGGVELYNSCRIAGSPLGTKHTDAAKAKMSKTRTGLKRGPHSEEHRAKLGAAHKGKLVSVATRKKASDIRVGKPTKQNTSGFAGVGAFRGRWRAQFRLMGVRHFVGDFDTPEEAHAALVAARAKQRAGQ